MDNEIVHVTRYDMAGNVFGHDARTCDPGGCAGYERHYNGLSAGDVEQHNVYEIRETDSGYDVVAEVQDNARG